MYIYIWHACMYGIYIYICVCVCIYLCIYVCMYVCMYIGITRTRAPTLPARMHVQRLASTHTHTHTHGNAQNALRHFQFSLKDYPLTSHTQEEAPARGAQRGDRGPPRPAVARGGGHGARGGRGGASARRRHSNTAVGFLDGLGEIIGDALDVRAPPRQ